MSARKKKEETLLEDPLESMAAKSQKEHKVTEATTETEVTKQENNVLKQKVQNLILWTKTHKKLSIPLAIVLLLVLVFSIPFTRYALAGTVLKKDITVLVKDESTAKPISKVTIQIGGKTAITNNEGKARLKLKVGKTNLLIEKKYYKNHSQSILVPITKVKGDYVATITATGRQVPVQVNNKIGGKPLENVLVKALDTEVKTDKDGKAIIVLPADKTSVEAEISADKFNTAKVILSVTEQAIKENQLQLTPSGKIYFLSKRSGKIDVVKTDLDGSNRQTVLAGTGKEEEYDTVLLASRDWKYLTLKARRDSKLAKLYLIDTGTDKVTTMDEGDASFTLNGWSDHRFVYTVSRNNAKPWQGNKPYALKSYNAENKQLTILDESTTEGTVEYDYAYTAIENVYIMGGSVVYVKRWSNSSYYPYQNRLANKSISITTVKPEGGGRKSLKDFPMSQPNGGYAYINTVLYKPAELYIKYELNSNEQFFELEDGTIKTTKDVTSDDFNKFYPTYLQSPSGKQTFWYEPRDGKNALFLGGADAEDEKQVGSLGEYLTYGWHSDDYLLISKGGSELYVLPKDAKEGVAPLKITDYHKPRTDFRGYGGGYGGI